MSEYDEEVIIVSGGSHCCGSAAGAGRGTESGGGDLRGDGAAALPAGADREAEADACVLHEAEGAEALPVRVPEGPGAQEVLEQPQRQEGGRRLQGSHSFPVLIRGSN